LRRIELYELRPMKRGQSYEGVVMENPFSC
jgi:hypothetical protein